MYIAINNSTKEVYYFKIGSKFAEFIGVSYATIARNIKNTLSERQFNDYIIVKPTIMNEKAEKRGQSFGFV